MTLRWYHWAAIVGGGLWFMQWRAAITLAPGNAEAAGENVSGQSQASGFSSVLGDIVSAIVNPPTATPTPTPTPTTTPTPPVMQSLAPSPVVQSPPSFSTVPNTSWHETPNTAA